MRSLGSNWISAASEELKEGIEAENEVIYLRIGEGRSSWNPAPGWRVYLSGGGAEKEQARVAAAGRELESEVRLLAS